MLLISNAFANSSVSIPRELTSAARSVESSVEAAYAEEGLRVSTGSENGSVAGSGLLQRPRSLRHALGQARLTIQQRIVAKMAQSSITDSVEKPSDGRTCMIGCGGGGGGCGASGAACGWTSGRDQAGMIRQRDIVKK
jgi:hypothetical protein